MLSYTTAPALLTKLKQEPITYGVIVLAELISEIRPSQHAIEIAEVLREKAKNFYGPDRINWHSSITSALDVLSSEPRRGWDFEFRNLWFRWTGPNQVNGTTGFWRSESRDIFIYFFLDGSYGLQTRLEEDWVMTMGSLTFEEVLSTIVERFHLEYWRK